MLVWQPFTVPCRPTVAAGTEAPAACGAAGGAAAGQQVARPVHDAARLHQGETLMGWFRVRNENDCN